jgi:outer membrane protein OmpA-like peptidoglycan-associated protein
LTHAAKKQASLMADTYYTVIRGKKYDRRMLELAEGLTSGKGDGRISVNDAKSLLRVVKDSNSYSPIEKQTMDYIRKHFKFTKEGDAYFRGEIRKWAAGKGKKKAAPKTPKAAKKATATGLPPAAADAPAEYSAPVTQDQPTQSAKPKGGALKEILLAVLLLVGLAALFYFIVYKSGCTKPAQVTVDTPVPAQPTTPKVEPVASEAKQPVATAATASEELKNFVEKTRLIFVAEKTAPGPGSTAKIQELAKLLKKDSARIQITGHTCSLGPKELNQKISEQRAQATKAALVAQGVSPDQVETRGVADSEPIGDNKTVAGRVANRRVSFKIVP